MIYFFLVFCHYSHSYMHVYQYNLQRYKNYFFTIFFYNIYTFSHKKSVFFYLNFQMKCFSASDFVAAEVS